MSVVILTLMSLILDQIQASESDRQNRVKIADCWIHSLGCFKFTTFDAGVMLQMFLSLSFADCAKIENESYLLKSNTVFSVQCLIVCKI